jgi:hypothetical protein
VSLWRRGDSPQARDALARAMSSMPDDPGRWIDLSRQLARFGRTKALETVLARVRAIAARRVSRDPDDEVAAAALAELLPDSGAFPGWTILQPTVMASAAGATLTRLSDGSVLAGGRNPVVDTYTIEAATTLAGITGLRLEALPDPSLPHHGPGRYTENGNFHLDAIRLSTVTEPGAPVRCRVPLTRAGADYSELNHGVRGVIGALDADPTTSWSIWPQVGRPHRAIFQTAEPFGTRTGTSLRVELAFRTRFLNHALGRFRLSVTQRSVPFLELSVARLKADGEQDGLTRLGAAYSLVGDWVAAATVLERAAARPDAPALDWFLLALARHHLGRPAEARSDCDRALERLRTDQAEAEARDVAIEALVTVRGLGVDQAKGLLLDRVFPAEPFGSPGPL